MKHNTMIGLGVIGTFACFPPGAPGQIPGGELDGLERVYYDGVNRARQDLSGDVFRNDHRTTRRQCSRRAVWHAVTIDVSRSDATAMEALARSSGEVGRGLVLGHDGN